MKTKIPLATRESLAYQMNPLVRKDSTPMLNKNLLYVNIVIFMFLLLCLALEAQGATATTCEVQPDGSVMCCELQPDGTELCTSSAQATPFVPTATPTETPTPTEIILIPLRPYRAFLPIIR